jgi:steroid delta-isomerase-like uncharacterized protein
MSLDTKAIARRFVGDFYNAGNLDLLRELCAPNSAVHDPAAPQGTVLESWKEVVRHYRLGLPDIHMVTEDMVAEDDKVAVRWTARATHTGGLMGIPPTGKQATIAGMTIHPIAGGNSVETWWNWDALGTMQQLGLLPTPGQTAQ